MGIEYNEQDKKAIDEILARNGNNFGKSIKEAFEYATGRIKEHEEKQRAAKAAEREEIKKGGSVFKSDFRKLVLDFANELNNLVAYEHKVNEAIDDYSERSDSYRKVTPKTLASFVIVNAFKKILVSKESAVVFAYSEAGWGAIKLMEGNNELLSHCLCSLMTSDRDLLRGVSIHLDNYI